MRLYEIVVASWYQDVRLQPKRLSTKKPRKLLPKPIRKIIVKRPRRIKSHLSAEGLKKVLEMDEKRNQNENLSVEFSQKTWQVLAES